MLRCFLMRRRINIATSRCQTPMQREFFFFFGAKHLKKHFKIISGGKQFRELNFITPASSTTLERDKKISAILEMLLRISRARGNYGGSFYLHFQTTELQSQYGFWQHHSCANVFSIIYVFLSCWVPCNASKFLWIMLSVTTGYRSCPWYFRRLHCSHPV